MIRAVLDTNVLASGFVEFADATRAPALLLRLWQEQRFELVVSADILAELDHTFSGPCFLRRLTPKQIAAAQSLLKNEATTTPIIAPVVAIAAHPEDDLVLAAAVSAEVGYLVTGDKPLRRLGVYRGILIVTPREFLDLL